jgi:hypothetical protein
MPKLHELSCAATRKNTGYGAGCPVDWKLIAGAFIFDTPVSFMESDLANLQTVLQNLAWQDSKTNRCYPIHKFLNPTDNTESPVIQQFSDGSKAKVRDGVYDWTFQFTAGAFCLLQAIRSHSGNGTAYVLFYDKEKKILGYNNNGDLSAIPMQILDAAPWKMNTGQATAAYEVHFVFSANYVNEDAEYTQADFNPENVVGLQDIKLKINGFNHTTGMANVSVITECGGANLYTLYSAALVAALWKATNSATGSDITVTSVTPLSSNQTFNVLLNQADPDYPTSNAINLQLAAPSALNSGGIPGYESEIASLTVISS